MPGIPSAVTDIFAQIEALSKVKPKTEAEAAGLEQAKQQLMNEAQRVSEGMDQMDPGSREPQNDGFTGRIDGKVFDAPWRGEFDMPGNFERRQRMSNSMANDAMLGASLGSKMDFDPSRPMESTLISDSPAHSAIMSELGPDWSSNKKLYSMGPVKNSKYGMPGDVQRLNRDKMLTEDQLKSIERMLSGPMAASADRLYGDNEVYQWMKQQGAGG
ncbi:MAG TPA: hypothetical protein VFI02_11335 [Armatimonadota bacterium]|nr:hypothetical protein [Armatimonadota bacterium]